MSGNVVLITDTHRFYDLICQKVTVRFQNCMHYCNRIRRNVIKNTLNFCLPICTHQSGSSFKLRVKNNQKYHFCFMFYDFPPYSHMSAHRDNAQYPDAIALMFDSENKKVRRNSSSNDIICQSIFPVLGILMILL